ncbi:MAG: four helix bundle protein [Gemmatimonadales bacterium]
MRGQAKADQLKRRTKALALRAISLCRSLPFNIEGRTFASQLLRSATSVGANYRAVCRARSRKEFVAKLGVVIEECDETLFWLELLAEAGVGPAEEISSLHREAEELLSIFVVSRATARRGLPRQKAIP